MPAVHERPKAGIERAVGGPPARTFLPRVEGPVRIHPCQPPAAGGHERDHRLMAGAAAQVACAFGRGPFDLEVAVDTDGGHGIGKRLIEGRGIRHIDEVVRKLVEDDVRDGGP